MAILGQIDASQARAYMDHVDRAYRQLDYEMHDAVRPGIPAPGFGLTVATRTAFFDTYTRWLDFLLDNRPGPLSLFVSDDVLNRVQAFEVELISYRLAFSLETMHMGEAEKKPEASYEKYPKPSTTAPPPQDKGVLFTIGEAVAKEKARQERTLQLGLVAATVIGGWLLVREVKK